MLNIEEIMNKSIDPNIIIEKLSKGNLSEQEYFIAATFFLNIGEIENAEMAIIRGLNENPNNMFLLLTKLDFHMLEIDLKDEFLFIDYINIPEDILKTREYWFNLRKENTEHLNIFFKKSSDNLDMILCKIAYEILYNNTNNYFFVKEKTVNPYNLIGVFVRILNFCTTESFYEYLREDIFLIKVWCRDSLSTCLVQYAESIIGNFPLDKATFVKVKNIFSSSYYYYLINPNFDEMSKIVLIKEGIILDNQNIRLIDYYCDNKYDLVWLNGHVKEKTLKKSNSYVKLQNESNGYLLKKGFVDSFEQKTKDFSITALGGSEGIGNSAIVLSYQGRNILLDAGMVTNEGTPMYPKFDNWKGVMDAIIISHCHMDHIGSITKAHAQWPNARIYLTHETKKLSEIQFRKPLKNRNFDSEILGEFLEYNEIKSAFINMCEVDFNQQVEIFNGCKFKFVHAGHIVGAAACYIIWNGIKIFYTGDFTIQNQYLVSGIDTKSGINNPDIMICEATYVSSYERNFKAQAEAVIKGILETLDKCGVVLLPANTFGQSQELISIIGAASDMGFFTKSIKLYIAGNVKDSCEAILNSENINPEFKSWFEKFDDLSFNQMPEENAIIVASPARLNSGSISDKIAFSLLSNPNVLNIGILMAERFDYYTRARYEKTINFKTAIISDNYPLSLHVSHKEIIGLFQNIYPKTVIVNHWGKSENKVKREFCKEIREALNGNCLVYDLKENIEYFPCDVGFWINNL